MKSNGKTVQLTAEHRTENKGAALATLRKSGRVPGVVYGPSFDSVAVHVDEKDVTRVARTGRSELFELQLKDGKKVPVLIKDMQKKNDHLIHVDFIQISKNKSIQVTIPIDFQGTAKGTKTGGVLQTQETEVVVEGLPNDLPASIEVDISGLDIGDKLSASDLKLPKGVTLVSSEEMLIASVTVLRAAETNTGEDTDASAEETAESTEE
ncbi:50S ribosomal protein L25 [Paenibacillus sp. Marseille-Q4541]|uniref:50S ribosomal protein L25 n=1 Tax=Paenibacillus sp. Marseille-Q4541 TaxID=2831522 RepID=UPI001BAA0521|nr:50S ribosomal protein L25 [Paenibacillus sp. Marseille-Q4541]